MNMLTPTTNMELRTSSRLIRWEAHAGRLSGTGPSRITWTVSRSNGEWTLTNDKSDDISVARSPEPLFQAAIATEAIKIACRGQSLEPLSIEGLLIARIFALAQAEEILLNIKEAGFDITGVDGPCEPWMRDEVIGLQTAVVKFETELVSRGWRLTFAG